ncbi:Appr-1-p processing protein [Patescibacteria group bacterium]|nr:Appr-1-p processing protein [Patescibacteria group bacterium]
MTKINYKKGNVIKAAKQDIKNNNLNIIIPHICNNQGKWGKGFVKALSNEWIEPENIYKKDYEYKKMNNMNILGTSSVSHVENFNIHIYNMIAQKLYEKNPIRYWALVKCMINIKKVINNLDQNNHHKIYCPKFGSGLAGGNWKFIERLILEIWVEKYDFDVTVFEF